MSARDDLREHAVPQRVRVVLAHACAQALADEQRVDLLHLKGPATAPGLRTPEARASGDADVLVRPGDLPRLVRALAETGWRQASDFDRGSPFAHAAAFHHDGFGTLDVHRHWPGFAISPDVAFDALWRTRGHVPLGGRRCAVPERAAQMLILATHAARGGRSEAALADLRTAWYDARPAEQERARVLAAVLGADTALTVALGGAPTGPDAALWRHFAGGGDVVDEWHARWAAARGPRARARLVRAALVPDRAWHAERLGRTPGFRDLLRAQAQRMVHFARRLVGRLVRTRGGWR